MSDSPTTGLLDVAVVTPEGAIYQGTAADVVVPAFDGEWAFYPGHAPFVALLGAGELRIRAQHDGVPERWYLAGGVVQVAHDRIVLLAESVRSAASIDRAAAERELAALWSRPVAGEAALEERLAAADRLRTRIRIAG